MELIARPANHHDMACARPNQQVGDQTSALHMIGTDRGNPLPQHTIERNDRAMDRRPIIRRMLGVRSHHDAVHKPPAQHIDVLGFTVHRISCGAQQGLQAVFRQHMLQAGRERGEEWMTDGRHDDADGVGAILGKIAGEIVRHIMQGAHGPTHAITHIVGDVPRAVHH